MFAVIYGEYNDAYKSQLCVLLHSQIKQIPITFYSYSYCTSQLFFAAYHYNSKNTHQIWLTPPPLEKKVTNTGFH